MDDCKRFYFGDKADRAIVMAKHRRLMEQHGGGRIIKTDEREWWEVPAALVPEIGNMAIRIW